MASIKKYATAHGSAWRVQYRSPDGRSRTKQGFRTKSEAQAWADKNATTIREGDWLDPTAGKVTVGELGDRWLAMQTHLKPSTLHLTKATLRLYVRPRWGHVPASMVKRSEVQEWAAGMGKGPSTVRRAVACLRQVLGMAVGDGILKANPAAGITLPRKPKPRHVYLTMGELQDFAAHTPRYPEIVLLLGTSGLRWGELAALRPCDLDPLRGRIHVTRNIVYVGKDWHLGTPKTHEARTVAVAKSVMARLVEVAGRRGPEELLWLRDDGRPLRPPHKGTWFYLGLERVQAARQELIDEAEKKGRAVPAPFPYVSPHGLRHVAAGLLVEAGANVKAVQRQLGHASAAMTLDTYSDLFDDGLDSIAATLDAGFSDAVGLSWNPAKNGGLAR